MAVGMMIRQLPIFLSSILHPIGCIISYTVSNYGWLLVLSVPLGWCRFCASRNGGTVGCHPWVRNTWLLLWLAVERPQLVLGERFSLSLSLFFWHEGLYLHLIPKGLNVCREPTVQEPDCWWMGVVRVMKCHKIAANCIWVHFWGQT